VNDRVKIAGAVVGGYVLGRTKKGRLAIKMALWLAGNDYRPANLLRNGVGRLADRPELAGLGGQIGGPLLSAGQQAIEAALEAQVNRIAGTLEQRTKAIADVGNVADGAAKGATKTAGGLKDSGRQLLKRSGRGGDETSEDESDKGESPRSGARRRNQEPEGSDFEESDSEDSDSEDSDSEDSDRGKRAERAKDKDSEEAVGEYETDDDLTGEDDSAEGEEGSLEDESEDVSDKDESEQDGGSGRSTQRSSALADTSTEGRGQGSGSDQPVAVRTSDRGRESAASRREARS